jgi:hypothetical protein
MEIGVAHVLVTCIFQMSSFPIIYCIKLSHAQRYPKHKNYCKAQKLERNREKGCVTLWLAIYIKNNFKAKEDLMETQMFQHAKM